MKWIGVLFVSPLWGMLSAQFFVQSWVSFIGLIIRLLGFVAGRVSRGDNLLAAGVSFIQLLLFSGLLIGGQYILSAVLGFGHSAGERIAYWIFAVPAFLFFVLQIPTTLKRVWANAMVTGALGTLRGPLYNTVDAATSRGWVHSGSGRRGARGAYRVALDTSVVRGIAHGDAGFAILGELRGHRSTLSVGLAGTAAVEIMLALQEGRLPWGDWARAVLVLADIIDDTSPIVPDTDEWQKVVVPGGTVPYASRKQERAMWRLLRRARSSEDLERGDVYWEGFWFYRSSATVGGTRAAVERHRERWRSLMDQVRAVTTERAHRLSQEELATMIANDIPLTTEYDSVRFDAYVRALARFVNLTYAGKLPYNPHSDGRRGDSLDYDLLMILAIPGFVCTTDDRLVQHIIQAHSVQATQLLSPAELVEHVRAGTLASALPATLR